jgi:nucleosome binding factor SPN SPT16 subunit
MCSPFLQEQESIYTLLLTLQTELLKTMQDGVSAREVYQHALSVIREKMPEYEKNFVKNIGFGVTALSPFNHGSSSYSMTAQMGMEFRDSTYLLSPKNARVLKTNMVFNLALGFSDLVDDSGKK